MSSSSIRKSQFHFLAFLVITEEQFGPSCCSGILLLIDRFLLGGAAFLFFLWQVIVLGNRFKT